MKANDGDDDALNHGALLALRSLYVRPSKGGAKPRHVR